MPTPDQTSNPPAPPQKNADFPPEHQPADIASQDSDVPSIPKALLGYGLGCFGLLVAAVLVVGIMAWMDYQQPRDISELSVFVRIDEQGQFLIANQDRFDWRNVTMFINGTTSGYRYFVPSLSSGESVTIPIAEFQNRSGRSFVDTKQMPKGLVVQALTEFGPKTSMFYLAN